MYRTVYCKVIVSYLLWEALCRIAYVNVSKMCTRVLFAFCFFMFHKV